MEGQTASWTAACADGKAGIRIICFIVMTDVRRLDSVFFFFSSRRRHTRLQGDWSSDVCSSDLAMSLVMTFGKAFSGAGIVTQLSILEGNGMARVLARPTLLAQTGQNASFLAGEIGRASCRERV